MPLPISYNIKNLAVRWNSSLITALTIGLAIFILAVSFAIVEGLDKAKGKAGRAENILILQSGPKRISESALSKEALSYIATMSGIKRQDGIPLVAPEIVTLINTPRALEPTDQVFIRLRGIDPKIARMQKDFELIRGEIVRPGVNELMAGKQLAEKFPGLALGKKVKLGKGEWTVVGHFSATGPGYDIELWGDVEQIFADSGTYTYNAVTMTLEDAGKFPEIERELKSDKRFQLSAYRENEYYAKIIDEEIDIFYTLGIFIFLVMATGAFFTTVNTVYGMVESRIREMAVLRTIGFSKFSVYVCFLVESCIITIAGGVLGILLLLPLDDFPVTKWQVLSEISYNLVITPKIALSAVAISALLGVIGGFLPAWKASRLNMAEILRK